MRLLFLFLILLPSFSFAETADIVIRKALSLNLDQDLQWRKLLHFERGTFGSFESQIASPIFFISPAGSKDLKSELEATINAFWTVPPAANEDQVPQCRFPARYAWLKTKLGSQVKEWPDKPCQKFQKFFQALRGSSVSIVFSSYFLNNPSSAFGHTFLRINKAPAADGKRFELLDYGVNFAANPDTKNPIIYAVKGMFGMFPGTFTSVPYYYKVREYNNAESRDLWEYELNVKPETVDMLVAHVWELGPTYINYWYLTQNCSFHMFTILEAADPNLDLTSRVKKYVIPSDTIQVLWQTPGLVRSFHFRPSIRTEFMKRASELNEVEWREFLKIAGTNGFSSDYESLPEEQKKHVLDTSLDYMDFQYAHEVQRPDTKETEFKNVLLSKRSKISSVSEKLNIEPPKMETPHLAHGSRRLDLGFRDTKESGGFYLFNYKFALHDELDPIQGYPEYAKITFFDLKFSYSNETKKVELEEWTPFEVISLSPWSDISKPLSWRGNVSVKRLRNENCDFCHAFQGGFGVGVTSNILQNPFLLGFFGVRINADYISSDKAGEPKWIPSAGPNIILRSRWSENQITVLEGWWREEAYVQNSSWREVLLSHQWTYTKNQGVRAELRDYGFDKAAEIKWVLYQ